MRLDSKRFPQKLIKTLMGKPLCLWALEKIQIVANEFDMDFRVIVWEGDRSLVNIVRELEIPIVWRTEVSARGTIDTILDGGLKEDFEFWERTAMFHPCLPFVPLDSYRKCLESVKDIQDDSTVLSVFSERGVVWDDGLRPLFDVPFLNTQTNPVYHRANHFFWCFASRNVITPKMNQPDQVVELPQTLEHLVDIDNPESLAKANRIGRILHLSNESVGYSEVEG